MKKHTIRNQTAQDAKAISAHMRRALDDAEYATPTPRELAGVRWAQEWRGRKVRRALDAA